MLWSKVKHFRCGAVARASLKRAKEVHDIDPKPGDLSMSRRKWK